MGSCPKLNPTAVAALTASLVMATICLALWDSTFLNVWPEYAAITFERDFLPNISIEDFVGNISSIRSIETTSKCDSEFSEIMRNYSLYHQQSLEAARAEKFEQDSVKFIVWRCDHLDEDSCAGLADRLQGIMTTFLLAIATRRVMLIDWPNLHDVYDLQSFNWTFDPALVFGRTTGGVGGCELCTNCRFPDSHTCMTGDPTDLTADVVVISSNINVAHMLFNDDYYLRWKSDLVALGVREDFSFGCSMRHIITPNRRVVQRFLPPAYQIVQPGTISVAIHVRMGDKELFGLTKAQHTSKFLDHVWSIFNHAENSICKNARDEGVNITSDAHRIVAVFLSDSLWLREAVRHKFLSPAPPQAPVCRISKVLVPATVPLHLSVHDQAVHARSKEAARAALQHKDDAYVSTVGEWWLISLCSYVVLEGNASGYSRTAYAYGMHRGIDYSGHLFASPGASGLINLRRHF